MHMVGDDDSARQDLMWDVPRRECTRQEEDDHHRVDNGEPVDLDITHGQVRVPSRCPLHFAFLQRTEKGQHCFLSIHSAVIVRNSLITDTA